MDLGTVVDSARESVGPLIEPAGHTLEVALPPAPVFVDAAPVRLAQVLANLLNNAAKYTDPGGTTVVGVAVRGPDVEVCVRDNGIGIAPEMLPHVFDMFRQGDETIEKAHGGLGIGLTLVRRLVELHGGDVQARRAGLGRGSELVVRLPILEPAPSRRPGALPSADMPRRRILVVDDNADAAQMLAMLLETLGSEVHVAPDGLAGLAKAEALRPDLILLDLGMPRMNGFEACQRIRAHPWGRTATVVALSGWDQAEHQVRARRAGFDHDLIKPVDVDTLRLLLESPDTSM